MIFADQSQNRIGEVDRHDMANKLKETDGIFDAKSEIKLFNAMDGVLKPVGINRFFTMLAIHGRFSSKLDKELSSKVIWNHFDTMYDMAYLHEAEIIPFPNDEVDFELPEEFDDILSETFGVVTSRTTDENEATKNSTNLKALKKLNASKLKQSTTPSSDVKNTFLTPVSIKPTKNFIGSRSEQRPSTNENNVKVKQDSPLPAKINKIKRSSSPFSTKNGKSEHSPAVKNEPIDASSKKTPKVDKNLATAKKFHKSESVPTSSSSKKTVKQELNANTVRQTKPETPDNSVKKIKNEKEQSGKKGKLLTSAENSKKASKLDGKASEQENNHKKSNDVSTSKAHKNSSSSSKAIKMEEMESSVPSGSRKSSTKVEVKDKKRKRQIEETSKKATPIAKRRRT